MLRKLKELFTRNKADAEPQYPVVELVDYEDGLLKIRYDENLSPHVPKVYMQTSYGVFEAEIRIESFDSDQMCYRAELLNKELLTSDLRLERRYTPRLPRVCRVFSRHIPGFMATTEDISFDGVRLKTKELLALDHDIPLRLELDDPTLEPMDLFVDVTWSAQRVDGTYHSGLRFQAMEHKHRRALESYIQERLDVEQRFCVSEVSHSSQPGGWSLPSRSL